MADYSFGFETNTISPLTTYSTHTAWVTQSTEKNSGTYAAKAGTIGHNGFSSMVLTHTAEKPFGTVTFYKKLSSEANWDYLKFYIDENLMGSWSGIDSGFSQAAIRFSGIGAHTFRWEYSKDSSATGGSDTVWVDDIVITESALDAVESFVRTNLTPNPGFEVNTTGWVSEDTSLSIARDTTQKLTGTASLKLYNNSAPSVTGYVYIATPRGTSGIPVQPSTDYSLSWSYMGSSLVSLPLRHHDGFVSWYNAAGTYISASVVDYYPDATWETSRADVTSPATAAFATLMFSRNDDGVDARAEDFYWLDNVLLEEKGDNSHRSYFDGSGSADGPSLYKTYAWTGTAHQSASTETYTHPGGNMLMMFFP